MENQIKKAKKEKNPKKNKGLKWVIIVLCVVAVAAFGLTLARKSVKGPIAENIIYTVKSETYENVIEISGNIAAAQSQELQAAGSGTVQKVYVKEGDKVKKGDVILELDATEQEYNLAELDYNIAQKKLNGSKREIELLEVKRDNLVKKLEDRKIVAYFDGIIAELDVAPGDYIEAKDSVGTLIDRSYMKASVEIVETDVAKLKPNQVVNFTFPAYEDQVVKGYVVSYPAIGTVTQRGATVVKAEVRIDNPPDEILPNYSFTGEIEITAPVTVTLVERNAIGYEDGKAYVEVLNRDGTFTKTDVEVQQYDSSYVKIIYGVKAGDRLNNLGANRSGTLRINSSGGFGGGSGFGGGMSSGMPSGGFPSGMGGMPGGR